MPLRYSHCVLGGFEIPSNDGINTFSRRKIEEAYRLESCISLYSPSLAFLVTLVPRGRQFVSRYECAQPDKALQHLGWFVASRPCQQFSRLIVSGRIPQIFAEDCFVRQVSAGIVLSLSPIRLADYEVKWTLLPPPYTRYDRSSTHPETGERRLDALRLHDRMPVILETGDWPVWLGDQPGDYTALLRAAPIGTVRLWPVSRAVNSVRSNGAELLDRVDDPHAPPPSDAPAGENPA